MAKTNRQLKEIAYIALKSEYGFAPSKKDIALMEAAGDGTYILFRVGTKQYRFNSYILHIGGMDSVWCGNGTINKIDE